MAHKHSVYDTDSHFRIDRDTRTIINMGETDTVLFRYDHNSERFTFELPRTIDGHDMSSCDLVQIHYINNGSTSREINEDVYEVTDLQVSPDSEDTVIFSWLVSANATQFVGPLRFSISFKCIDENGKVEYAWSTAIHDGISINEALNNGGSVVARYSDVLEEWEVRLFGQGSSSSNFDLTDPTTKKTYKLHVVDGKLTMSEVTD